MTESPPPKYEVAILSPPDYDGPPAYEEIKLEGSDNVDRFDFRVHNNESATEELKERNKMEYFCACILVLLMGLLLFFLLLIALDTFLRRE